MTDERPEAGQDESLVEFRLTYDGELKSASKSKGRVEHKHEIRRVFHGQLKALWAEHKALEPQHYDTGFDNKTRFQQRMQRYERDGFKWAPLVVREHWMVCEVEVLILRRGPPGDFVMQGDIDGKVKTLFDALQIPEPGVLPSKSIGPEADEEPFYCLLEDDSLIVKASIETDSLFGPLSVGGLSFEQKPSDARVIIKVKTRKTNEPAI
jgi:hypothetical protein